jgi:glycosyltransferase involved in cell wall biosynthesis
MPSDLFCYVAVGALTSRKGHDHLIKAAAPHIRNGEKIGVVICGPGNPAELKALAQSEGIEKNVFFFTGLSEKELMRLYRASDAYCDASNTPRACLGMSLTEAMIMGMPVISYDAGGMPEVVKEGYNGMLVETNNIHALSDALLKLKNTSDEQKVEFGKNGMKIAYDMVDIEKEAIQVVEVLKKICK